MNNITISCCIWLCRLDISDWIAISGIIVQFIIALWIVKVLQKRLTNERFLKDYFIKEVIDLRNDYRLFYDAFNGGKLIGKNINSQLKNINVKIGDVMNILNEKYKIDNNILKEYHVDLRKLITEQDEYIKGYKSDKLLFSEESSIRTLNEFRQERDAIFNKLIIDINNKN